MKSTVFSLNDLALFEAVYHCRNITAAADQMFISRQSASKAINTLEKQTKQKLFERTASGVKPTEFCHALHAHVNTVFESLSSLEKFVAASHSADTITIGLIGKYYTGNKIEELAKQFCLNHEHCKIYISYYTWPDVIDAVVQHEIDCAYSVLIPSMFPENLSYIEVTSEPMLFVSHKNAPDSDLPCISAQLLADKPIALLTQYSIQANILQAYAEENHLSLMKPVTTTDVFLINEYIQDPQYTVILEEHSVNKLLSGQDVAALPVDPPIIRRSGLIYCNDRPFREIHREFFSFLQKRLPEIRLKRTV